MDLKKHNKRVVSFVHKFAKHLGYDDTTVSYMTLGAAFHDIGKLFIPDEVWKLPRRLTKDEFKIVMRHPKIGYEVLEYITDNDVMLNMCLYHHERWDGSGYPNGLKELEIPIEARIMSLCDVYEALTTERHYKSKVEVDDALGIMEIKFGDHFDPELGEKFVSFIREEQKKELKKIESRKSLVV